MRLYPPAWGIGRRAINDCEVKGYRIPAGTNVFLMQWITHRDERYFPDPERFDPERWREDPVRRCRIPRFAYFPFGGGPRVCVGAGFAMMEATLLLATIAQRYSFSLAPNAVITPLLLYHPAPEGRPFHASSPSSVLNVAMVFMPAHGAQSHLTEHRKYLTVN